MTPSRSSTEPAAPESAGWKITLFLLAVLCSIGGVIAIRHIHPADHVRIKHTCEALVSAVERRDAKTAEGLLSNEYRDGRGLDRARLVRNLFIYLDAHALVHVTPLSISIDDLTDDRASVTAKIWLAQANPPPQGERDAVQLDLSLRREGGTWKVASAEDWEVPPGDFEQTDNE